MRFDYAISLGVLDLELRSRRTVYRWPARVGFVHRAEQSRAARSCRLPGLFLGNVRRAAQARQFAAERHVSETLDRVKLGCNLVQDRSHTHAMSIFFRARCALRFASCLACA